MPRAEPQQTPGPVAAGGFARVLVGDDGSEGGEDARVLALRLLDTAGGRLTSAAVAVEHSLWRPRHGVHPDQVTAAPAAALPASAPDIRATRMSITAATAARGLTELAETMGADLVVIGSSDTHGAGRVALGRTAGRLLRGARRPVAIAASGSREAGPFRHVGVAFDGSPEAELALRTAFAIAARDRAAVSLFQALLEAPFTSEDEQSVRWKTRLRAQATLDAAAESAPAGVNPRTVLLRGEPSRVIADGCEGVVDLLVTGSRAYGPLQRAVLGSVSAELVDGAPCPVLVPGRHPEGAARDGEPVADVRLAD